MPFLRDFISWLSTKPLVTRPIARTGMRLGFANTQELRKLSPQAVYYDFETAFPQDFFLRLDKGPYADIRVRRALSLSVDRDERALLREAVLPGPVHGGFIRVGHVPKYSFTTAALHERFDDADPHVTEARTKDVLAVVLRLHQHVVRLF